MPVNFRLAKVHEIEAIWDILQQAIIRRKNEGSNQWQDGYPNIEILKNDIYEKSAFVLTEDETIVGYASVSINNESEYENLEGKWLSNGDYIVFHRVAISESFLGKGYAKKMMLFIEDFARQNNIYSIKADTNFDNPVMLNLFDKYGYTYCGKIYYDGSERRAFEKILDK